MKKLLTAAAILLVASYSFAFTNKINIGGVYSSTTITPDVDDADSGDITGSGLNLSWRGTCDNGLTFIVDLDVIPNAKLENDDNDDWTDASFAFGIGKEFAYEKGCIALAGIFGAESCKNEIAGYDVSFDSTFIGANLYVTYMFNKTVGLYGSITAGISVGGTFENDMPFSKNVDLKSGDMRFAPKCGVVIQF